MAHSEGRSGEARTGEKPAVREHRKENARKTQSKDSKTSGHQEDTQSTKVRTARQGDERPRGLSACLRKQAVAHRDSTKARTGTNEILAMLTAGYLPRPATHLLCVFVRKGFAFVKTFEPFNRSLKRRNPR